MEEYVRRDWLAEKLRGLGEGIKCLNVQHKKLTQPRVGDMLIKLADGIESEIENEREAKSNGA